MLTLYDYLPSQNAWKVRQFLAHLQRPYRRVIVSIFEGEGQRDSYRNISPTGTVPALQLDDGRTLSESNAILCYLADGTEYFQGDAFARAKILQWLSFEQERIESQIGALRHWTLTGKLARRDPALIATKRHTGANALSMLERELTQHAFITGDAYTIADIALYAYTNVAEEAGFTLAEYPAISAWLTRIAAQPGHLRERFAYAIDPHSHKDL